MYSTVRVGIPRNEKHHSFNQNKKLWVLNQVTIQEKKCGILGYSYLPFKASKSTSESLTE